MEALLPGEQGPGDTSQPGSEGHDHDIPLWLGGQYSSQPSAQTVEAFGERGQRTARAVDEQRARVAIPSLGDTPEPSFAAARILARRQAESGR